MPAITYSKAIECVIFKNGMISRAGITKGLNDFNLSNSGRIKSEIVSGLKTGRLMLDGSCYVLGSAIALFPNNPSYYTRLDEARAARSQAQHDKEAQKKRVEKKYSKALKAAGGLTMTAESDRAWLEGNGGTCRPGGRLCPM